MRESLRVAHNTMIQVVGRVFSLGISIVIIGIVTRYLGPQDFGHFTTITAYLFFFAVFAELGLYVLVSRELPLVPDQSIYLSDILSLKTFVSGIFFCLSIVVVFVTPYPLPIQLGVLLSVLGYWANSFVSLFSSFFQFKLATKSIALGDVLNKLIIILIVAIVWFADFGLYGVVIAFTLGLAGQSWYLLRNVQKITPIRFHWNPTAWRAILGKTWPYALSGILILFYFKADTLILSFFQPARDVGVYGASYRLLEVVISFPALFTGLLLPLLSKSFEENNRERFQSIWQRSFDLLSLVSAFIIFFTLGTAEEILFYLTGSEFVVGANALRLLIVATGFIFLAHLTTFSVGALNVQKKMVKFYVIASGGALTLYFFLIPQFSYLGAAVTTLLVEGFIFFASYYLVRKHFSFAFSWRNTFVSVGVGILSLGVLLLLKPISIFLAAPMFALIFILLGFATKTIDRSMISEFLNSGLNKFKSTTKPS